MKIAFNTKAILVSLLLLQAVLVKATETVTPGSSTVTETERRTSPELLTNTTAKSSSHSGVTGSTETSEQSTTTATPVVHNTSPTEENNSTGSTSHPGSHPTTNGETGNATEHTTDSHQSGNTTVHAEATTTTTITTTPKPTYPSGDKRNCNVTKVLNLPGHGWDNLDYSVKDQIFFFNYSHCQLTPDGKYLIPDEVYSAPLDYEQLQSEVFKSWNDYSNLTASQLKHDSGLDKYYDVAGTFSADFHRAKKSMVEHNAITVRVSLQRPKYTFAFVPGKMTLKPEFKSALINISELLVNGHSEVAQYYADLLVSKYGTHFVKDIKTGGVLATEDAISSTYVDLKHAIDVMEFKVVAEAIFANKFDLISKPDKTDKQLEERIEAFKNAAQASTTFVHGGEHKDLKTLTVAKWEKTIENHQDVIERRGQLLDSLISTKLIPELPRPLVIRVKTAISDAINRYHDYNSHSGCTNPTATNFDFAANRNDHTCNVTDTSVYAFGGVFQTCSESSGEHDFCNELAAVNPATGHYSCPKHFEAIQLRDKGIDKMLENKQNNECRLVCPEFYYEDCRVICSPEIISVRVEYQSYWCALKKPVKGVKGVPFGGTYTERTNNVHTNAKACPSKYEKVTIDLHVNVCVGTKPEDFDRAMTFGGFFSCIADNPLVDYFASKNCPTGYSSVTANIDKRCAINYCRIPETKTKDYKSPSLVHLASGKPPKVDDNTTVTLVIIDETNGDFYWRKPSTGPWKVAHNFKELVNNHLDGVALGKKNENDGKNVKHEEVTSAPEDDGMSGGAIAAIAIVTTAAVLAAVGGGYYYMKKRGGLNRSDSTSNLHSNESQPEETLQRSGSGSRNQPEEPQDQDAQEEGQF